MQAQDSITTPRHPLLLRTGEVAALLGLGKTTAAELIYRNEIPSVRIGRARRVRYADLRRWVKSREVEP